MDHNGIGFKPQSLTYIELSKSIQGLPLRERDAKIRSAYEFKYTPDSTKEDTVPHEEGSRKVLWL